MPIDKWLRELGLERYAAAFEANDVTDDLLPTLTADDLRDIGITSVGHRRRILDAIGAARAQGPAPAARDRRWNRWPSGVRSASCSAISRAPRHSRRGSIRKT